MRHNRRGRRSVNLCQRDEALMQPGETEFGDREMKFSAVLGTVHQHEGAAKRRNSFSVYQIFLM